LIANFAKKSSQKTITNTTSMNQRAEQLLKTHGLRVTNVRTQVLNIFFDTEVALAHSDIEGQMGEVDRITLYRTLKSFEDKGLIHKAIDGSDKPKFALCQDECDEHEHHDHHAHFHCDDCGSTYCLEEVEAPMINAPNGFKVATTHLVVTGKCEKCL